MDGETTRRTFLAGSSVAIVLGTAVTATAQSDGDCPEADQLSAELSQKEDRLSTLRAENRGIRDGEIPTLQSETETILEQWRADQHQYDDDELDQAKQTGIAMRESIVQLRVEYANSADFDLSTAWYAAEDLLLTNSHNVSGYRPEDTIEVTTLEGSTFECDLVDRQEQNNPDVALLRASQSGTPLTTGSAEDLSKGDRLVQVGHPGDLGNWVITMGELLSFTDVTGRQSETDFQASVPGMQGSSGSPIATLDGTVVGMLYSGRTPPGGPDSGPPEPASLDVRTAPISNETTGGVAVTATEAMRLLEEWT